MPRIKLNVSGTLFEFDSNILRNVRGQKLEELCNSATQEHTYNPKTNKCLADVDNDGVKENNKDNENDGKYAMKDGNNVNNECKDGYNVGEDVTVFIDRPARSFAAILSFYQTGELHIPLDVCPGSFQREMDYWRVDQAHLTECCSYRMSSFLDERETRRNFTRETRRSRHTAPGTSSSGLNYLRWRIWSIIDYHENTMLAKIYFIVISLVVLLSILSLALSTESSMRRRLTKCEILEYLEHSEHADAVHVADDWEHLDCDNPHFDVDDDYDFLHEIFDDGGAIFYDDYLGENVTISLPDMTVPIRAFVYLDTIILAIFTGDVVLRLFSWPSFFRYFLSIVNVVDIVALITAYVYLILLNIEREHRYAHSWLHILNYFQVFRSLRLLRIVKKVRASQVLAYSLRQNIKDIAVLLLFLFFGVSTFACIIYFAESRKVVRSIPDGWYFSIITLTTVGYGDVTPKTTLGAVVASLCAVMGIVLIAATVPIFVNNFLTLYQYAVIDEFTERMQSSQVKQADEEHAVDNGIPMKTPSTDGDNQTNKETPRNPTNNVSVISVREASSFETDKERNVSYS